MSNRRCEQPVRRASHAGSWYPGSCEELQAQVQRLLGQEYAAGALPDPKLKAVIAPHAGLSYSGSVAANVYSRVDVRAVRCVFILGPSHHVALRGCALPAADVAAYRTPMGDLPLDQRRLESLRATGKFSTLRMSVDEAEHSLEMQLPFLAQLFLHSPLRSRDLPPVTLVPIMVGDSNSSEEAAYAKELAPLLEMEGNLFVISSDFCHWGANFRYTGVGSPRNAQTYRDGPHLLNAQIEGLDREGMDHIVRQDAEQFRKYLKDKGNTICGRNPIVVFLEMLGSCQGVMGLDFVKYAQSSAAPGAVPLGPDFSRVYENASSVSYACACCVSTTPLVA